MFRKLVAKKQDDGAVTSELVPLTQVEMEDNASSSNSHPPPTSNNNPMLAQGHSSQQNPSQPNTSNGAPGLNLSELGILRNVVSKWKSFSTKRKETGDKSSMYRKGPAPLDEPGKKKRKTMLRCTHGTLDSDVESVGESDVEPGADNSLASSKGLILYFAKLATSRDEDETVDLQFVYSLLQGGADINFTDKHGQSILHEISRAWHSDVAKFLLSHGADINKGDKFGRTPLHLAVSVGYTEMILFLVENGANINARTTNEWQTPIHYAAKNNSVPSLRTLLKLGASINDRDYKSRTPLFVAAESGMKMSLYAVRRYFLFVFFFFLFLCFSLFIFNHISSLSSYHFSSFFPFILYFLFLFLLLNHKYRLLQRNELKNNKGNYL